MAVWSPDPREARCVRWNARMPHTYRLGSLWPDGLMRCVHCFRVKGRRYPKPRAVA
jgi:hypothetical protein